MAEIRYDMEIRRRIGDLERQVAHGGGGGDNGDMGSRLDRLEDFAEETGGRLARVETKLDYIEKEVSSFKWWLIGAVLTIMLTTLGTSIGIQQMTVATFQGAAQIAREAAPIAQPAPIIIQTPAPATPPAQSSP